MVQSSILWYRDTGRLDTTLLDTWQSGPAFGVLPLGLPPTFLSHSSGHPAPDCPLDALRPHRTSRPPKHTSTKPMSGGVHSCKNGGRGLPEGRALGRRKPNQPILGPACRGGARGQKAPRGNIDPTGLRTRHEVSGTRGRGVRGWGAIHLEIALTAGVWGPVGAPTSPSLGPIRGFVVATRTHTPPLWMDMPLGRVGKTGFDCRC